LLIEDSMMMLLGDNGLQILETMAHGPVTIENIHMITGVPLACIQSRIPVLQDLNLILESENGYVLDSLGQRLLRQSTRASTSTRTRISS
jgi:predicted transcriptional regulator